MADATTSTAISTTDVQSAATELAKMRRSLRNWMRYRALNDSVLAGTPGKTLRKPLAYAQRVIAGGRNMQNEQDLATKLSALLGQLMPTASLPSSDVTANPDAAVQLAQIAITGVAPVAVATPTATSGLGVAATHPWLWPVLIVGGLLLFVTTAITSSADLARQQEEDSCIEAGACTDYGFWLKAGGVVVLGWFAWTQLGVGDKVKSFTKKGGR